MTYRREGLGEVDAATEGGGGGDGGVKTGDVEDEGDGAHAGAERSEKVTDCVDEGELGGRKSLRRRECQFGLFAVRKKRSGLTHLGTPFLLQPVHKHPIRLPDLVAKLDKEEGKPFRPGSAGASESKSNVAVRRTREPLEAVEEEGRAGSGRRSRVDGGRGRLGEGDVGTACRKTRSQPRSKESTRETHQDAQSSTAQKSKPSSDHDCTAAGESRVSSPLSQQFR